MSPPGWTAGWTSANAAAAHASAAKNANFLKAMRLAFGRVIGMARAFRARFARSESGRH
jgi:hypothetical protein